MHGCTVEDEAFVGMGATLLDGVVVEKHGMVAAGALVRQNTRIPAGEVHLQILFISHESINLLGRDFICLFPRNNLEGFTGITGEIHLQMRLYLESINFLGRGFVCPVY